MGHTPRSIWLKTIAAAAAGSLVLAACSSDNSGDTDTVTSSAENGGGGVVVANSTEPQNPLVPTNTSEVGGGRIIQLIFSGLVYYDAEGAPQNEVAESIESSDGQNYTITLKDGWTFTNGEPVTSDSFIDAWNYAALSTNAQLGASFMEPIEGYADVNYCEPDAGPPNDEGKPTCLPAPKAETMSGLQKVSDTEFTVKLVDPQSDFPLRLGYSAYYPMPQSAYEDMEAFGENPSRKRAVRGQGVAAQCVHRAGAERGLPGGPDPAERRHPVQLLHHVRRRIRGPAVEQPGCARQHPAELADVLRGGSG